MTCLEKKLNSFSEGLATLRTDLLQGQAAMQATLRAELLQVQAAMEAQSSKQQ